MKATAKDLRLHSKELLDAVSRGEEVTITYRGKARAKLVPVTQHRRRPLKEAPAFGLWKDHKATKDVNRYIDKLRESRR